MRSAQTVRDALQVLVQFFVVPHHRRAGRSASIGRAAPSSPIPPPWAATTGRPSGWAWPCCATSCACMAAPRGNRGPRSLRMRGRPTTKTTSAASARTRSSTRTGMRRLAGPRLPGRAAVRPFAAGARDAEEAAGQPASTARRRWRSGRRRDACADALADCSREQVARIANLSSAPCSAGWPRPAPASRRCATACAPTLR